MIELNSAFLHRFVRAAANLGQKFNLQNIQGIKEVKQYAYTLLEHPDSPETKAVLDQLSLQRDTSQQKMLNPGFRPKMDLDFQIAEKDNYFRRGKAYPGIEEPEPPLGQP